MCVPAPVRLFASGEDSNTTWTGVAMGTKDQIGVTVASTVFWAISQSLMISWLVSAVSKTMLEPSTREVAAAAGAIVVGRDDELHRVGHRLAAEREIDDPSCLCI